MSGDRVAVLFFTNSEPSANVIVATSITTSPDSVEASVLPPETTRATPLNPSRIPSALAAENRSFIKELANTVVSRGLRPKISEA